MIDRADDSRRRPVCRDPLRPRSSSSSNPSSSLKAPPKLAVSSGPSSCSTSIGMTPSAASNPCWKSVTTKVRARVAPFACNERMVRSDSVRTFATRARRVRSICRSRHQTRHDSRMSTARSWSDPTIETTSSPRFHTNSRANVTRRSQSPQQATSVRTSLRRRRRLNVGGTSSPSGTNSVRVPLTKRSACPTTASGAHTILAPARRARQQSSRSSPIAT